MQLISNHNLARHHRHETLCLLGLFLECKNVFLSKAKAQEGQPRLRLTSCSPLLPGETKDSPSSAPLFAVTPHDLLLAWTPNSLSLSPAGFHVFVGPEMPYQFIHHHPAWFDHRLSHKGSPGMSLRLK